MRPAWVLVLVGMLAGCGGMSGRTLERGAVGSCTRIRGERQIRGQALCEDVWTCVRPPGGPFDRVGLRRTVACAGAGGPLVLYLPGMHMNGDLRETEPDADLRLFLARAGARVWSIDYRTHAVPDYATPEQLAPLAAWTADTFAGDVSWAIGFMRGAEAGKLHLVGFSYGAGLAYRVAATESAVDGLVILDGMPTGLAGGGTTAAIDVGSSRLPYEDRQRLLRAVQRDPDGPSPIAGYRTAGEALADILYTARSFGGQGGLSNAKGGVSEPSALAGLLVTYDRWWPGAVLGAGSPKPSRVVPVLAFAGAQAGEPWVERVRAGAKAFGGEGADVRVLPRHGHLDVLVGKDAARLVYEPIRAWLEQR